MEDPYSDGRSFDGYGFDVDVLLPTKADQSAESVIRLAERWLQGAAAFRVPASRCSHCSWDFFQSSSGRTAAPFLAARSRNSLITSSSSRERESALATCWLVGRPS